MNSPLQTIFQQPAAPSDPPHSSPAHDYDECGFLPYDYHCPNPNPEDIRNHSTPIAPLPTTTKSGAIAVTFNYDPRTISSANSTANAPISPQYPNTHTTTTAPNLTQKHHYDSHTVYYYGFRFYSPGQGRFLNRDPIEEMGGLNLYAFVGNDPVNRWDYLGLSAHWEKVLGVVHPPTGRYRSVLTDEIVDNPFLHTPPRRKRCGVLVLRRVNKPCAPVPHSYLRTEKGTAMDLSGSDADVDGMWTIELPIWIPINANCDEFSRCMLDSYSQTGDVICYGASYKAITECGGSIF